MAKLLAGIVVVASCIFSECNSQGYGGVPQAPRGVRTTTTFAPDVIPSDKQAEIFYQKNPNPEDVQRPPVPQYNQPGPAVPQYNKPNPAVPQYNKPNPAVPQYNPQPNPSVPQNTNPQPGGQYPGPLPDNSVYAGSFTDSQATAGPFWWMKQDNPFKGADVPPQPPKGSNPPPNAGPTGGVAPNNNPNNPFLNGGVKPSGSYPAPNGNNPGSIVNNPSPSGNNPNNPFLSGGVKPSGPYPIPSGSNPPPSGVNPNNPFVSGNKEQGCSGGSYSGCGGQAPQGGSYPDRQGVPCSGSGYLCVSKSNCNNGVVVDNGLVQIKAGVQRCDAVSQACCRLPSSPNYPGSNGPVKPIGGNPPYQGNPNYQGQGSAPGTNGVPIGGSIYDRPVTPNPNINPYTGPLNVTPYPGCAAALKCVELIYCTAEGVMTDIPQALTREQEENRVPLSECSNPDTGILGKCCRDPNYKDPWPGGMMMHVHHEGDHGGQFIDQQGFPTGQYDASQGSPSQQHQFNQQATNINVPQPFPQKPFQPQPAPQQTYQPQPKPQYRPQPQQPQQPAQNIPQYQPQQNNPKPTAPPQQYQPQQNNPKPTAPPQQYQPQFPQESQNIPKPQPFPQQPPPQQFPQQPPNQQNFPKPAPQPIVPQYQSQKPDLPPWQPTQVNFASQTPEKIPYQPPQAYPSPPQQQYEPAQGVPKNPGSDNRCGIKGNVDRSGLSDLDVAEGEFPWHAIVLSSAEGKPLCSGAVVSDRAIVTAAHCVNNLESRDISVSVGGIRLGAQSTYPVAAVARHPKFDAVSQFNDLAVLILSQPSSGLRPICLPANSAVVGGKTCIATGYSRQALQSNSGSLHQVEVYSVPRDVCEQKLKATNLGKYYTLNPSFTCALPENPQASLCEVGAGSPISCERSGEYQLGGTYSWDVGCTQETPAALAAPDVDWIRSVLSRPIEDVLREEQNEVEKRKASQEVVDAESKPGFSQGYGK